MPQKALGALRAADKTDARLIICIHLESRSFVITGSNFTPFRNGSIPEIGRAVFPDDASKDVCISLILIRFVDLASQV